MKFLLLLIISLPVFGDVSLNDAYKREHAFLLAQKNSLLSLKAGLQSSLKERKARAQTDINQKQRELSGLMLKNQELTEEFKALEKMTKENSQMSGQLEKNAIKINENFSGLYAKLGMTPKPSENSDPVKRFEGLLDEAYYFVMTISGARWKSQAFLNESDQLVQGEVLFQGLFSARGKLDGKIYSLVPYNNEFLKVSGPFTGEEVHLFSPNFERSGLKAAKTWKESVADTLPGVVMILIMLCVLGLFILLARS